MAKTVEITLKEGDRVPERKIWPQVKPGDRAKEILAAI
jgi:hypothetical protein